MYLCCKYEYDTTYTCKDIYNQKLFTKIHYFRSTQKPCTGKSLRKCQKSSIFWIARAKMGSGRAKMEWWWGIGQFISKKHFFIILVWINHTNFGNLLFLHIFLKFFDFKFWFLPPNGNFLQNHWIDINEICSFDGKNQNLKSKNFKKICKNRTFSKFLWFI